MYRIVRGGAHIKYWVSMTERRTVIKNLRTAFPDATPKALAKSSRQVFINFGYYLVDFFSVTAESIAHVLRHTEVRGKEYLDKALSRGKGCIVLTGHFGNWELGGCILAQLGYTVNSVALAHSDPRINAFFIAKRHECGFHALPIGSAKTGLQRALVKNELIAILGDRPYGDKGIAVPFFGKPALMPRGAALMSIRNESPLVTAFMHRNCEKPFSHTLVIEELAYPRKENACQEEIKRIVQLYLARFEDHIRINPEQWYMFHRIWAES